MFNIILDTNNPVKTIINRRRKCARLTKNTEVTGKIVVAKIETFIIKQ